MADLGCLTADLGVSGQDLLAATKQFREKREIAEVADAPEDALAAAAAHPVGVPSDRPGPGLLKVPGHSSIVKPHPPGCVLIRHIQVFDRWMTHPGRGATCWLTSTHMFVHWMTHPGRGATCWLTPIVQCNRRCRPDELIILASFEPT